MYKRHLNIRFLFFLIPACLFAFASYSQPVWTFDPFGKASTETKSEEYKERLLPSERTADKKFTIWRKFTHNNATHFNYYFNANNKLNLVLYDVLKLIKLSPLFLFAFPMIELGK